MISIISGTNRYNSKSKMIASIYQNILNKHEIYNEIIDLSELPNDFIYSALYDNSQKNTEFNKIADRVVKSTKIVFVIPEYNGSFPGVLKAFIDGLPHPHSLKNKKGAMIGLSSGAMGAAIAMSNFSDVLGYMGMHLLANRPKLSNIENYLNDGILENPKYLEQLENHAKILVDF